MIEILKRPLVTEKMSALQEKGQYTFEVDLSANKIAIAKAVQKKFNVTVVNVRTINVKGKAKTQMTRRGRFAGRTAMEEGRRHTEDGREDRILPERLRKDREVWPFEN